MKTKRAIYLVSLVILFIIMGIFQNQPAKVKTMPCSIQKKTTHQDSFQIELDSLSMEFNMISIPEIEKKRDGIVGQPTRIKL